MSDHWLSAFESASVRSLKSGETLFRRSDRVRNAFLVRTGRVLLQRAIKDGGLLTLHVANQGELVAEGSLFAERYHCDAIVDLNTSVAVLSRSDLLAHMAKGSSDGGLSMRAFERTARELQSLRTR
ncbi:MAG: cyclic nucleotide-binding domain-containing protein, partial [Pseudomonadota bacterium]